jgi:hypothetical protein
MEISLLGIGLVEKLLLFLTINFEALNKIYYSK